MIKIKDKATEAAQPYQISYKSELVKRFLSTTAIEVPSQAIDRLSFILNIAFKYGYMKEIPESNFQEVTEDTFCAMTGEAIAKGTLVQRTKQSHDVSMSSSFNDTAHMTKREMPYITRKAAHFDGQSLVLSNAVITQDGVFKFVTNEEFAFWLLKPPTTPFIMCRKTTTNPQHTVWKAPMNYSNQVLYMQFGDKVLHISRKNVFEAFDAMENNPKLALFMDNAKSKTERTEWPFENLKTHETSNLNFGAANWEISPEVQLFLQDFHDLSFGDLYALGILVALRRKSLESWQQLLEQKEPIRQALKN